jgi:hypothetical protein
VVLSGRMNGIYVPACNDSVLAWIRKWLVLGLLFLFSFSITLLDYYYYFVTASGILGPTK